MKNIFKKLIAPVVCLLLTICMLASCGSGAVAVKYGSRTIDEADYAYLMAMVKGMFENNFSKYYGLELENVYDLEFTEDKTVKEYIEFQVEETAKLLLVVEQLCKDAGISVTDPSVISSINSALQDLEDQYGGKDGLNIELAKRGCNRETLERYEYFQALYELLLDYRYGENGVAKIASSDVKKAFDEQYTKFCAYQFPLASYGSDGSMMYFTHDFMADYTKSELKKYMMEHCMYCGYLSFEERESFLNAKTALLNGTKTIDELKEECDKSEVAVINRDKAGNTIYKELINKEVGDYVLIEDDEGCMIVFKAELKEEQFTDEIEKQVREAKLSFDAEQFFKENFRTAGHILYEKEADAKKVLQDIKDGKTTFADHESDTIDVDSSKKPSIEYTFSYGDMQQEFEDAVFDMEVGELRIAQTQYGFHLIERRELNTEAFDEDQTVIVMSRLYMKDLAKDTYEALKSGDIDFQETDSDSEFVYRKPDLLQISGLDKSLTELLTNAKDNEIVYWDAGASGIIVFKKLAMAEEDFRNKYEAVEDTLVVDAYDAYLSGYFDSVTVVRSVVDKFDVRTSKSLAS